MSRLWMLIPLLAAFNSTSAEDPFIPQGKLPKLIGTEVEMCGYTSAAWKLTVMDVIDPNGGLPYSVMIGWPTEAGEALRKVRDQGKAVKLHVRGKLYWTGRDWRTELEKRGAIPSGGWYPGYYLSPCEVVSWEVVDDPKERYIGQKFYSWQVEPFLGLNGGNDGFIVRDDENIRIVKAGFLDGPDHWHPDIKQAILTSRAKGQPVRLRFVGLVKDWEWKNGLPHYRITMWSAEILKPNPR